MTEFISFFIILLAALFLSEIFRQFHLPWVITLILAGFVIGPNGLGLFQLTPTLDFFGKIGLVFLMFMAGLQIRFTSFLELRKEIVGVSILNGLLPFVTGIGIGLYFGFPFPVAFLLGVIFISSSIAVIIPSLEATGLEETRLGKSIIASTVIEDVASLVLLSVFLQTIDPVTALPLPLFYALLLAFLVILRLLIPKLKNIFFPPAEVAEGGNKDLFEKELRFIFTVLIGTVIIFELLSLHAIIAGFFAGLILSGVITSEIIQQKLHAISYGLFIPVFFIIIGSNINLGVFLEARTAISLTAIIILGSLFSKFIGGWVGGRIAKFSARESAVVGASTLPQLSTTLAVVFTGSELGLLNEQLVTVMIILSIITTLLGPLLVNFFIKPKEVI